MNPRLFMFFLLPVMGLPACDPSDPDLNEYGPCCVNDPVVKAIGVGNIYIPNIFTPNNDGNNDVFFPNVSTGIKKIENFEVRSPSGQLLYSKSSLNLNDPAVGWSGMVAPSEAFTGKFTFSMMVFDQEDYSESVEGSACSYPCDAPVEDIGEPSNCFFPNQQNGNGGLDTSLSSADCF